MDAAFWQAIVDTDYAVPRGHTPRNLLPDLVRCLGSTDSRLRDDYGYGILVRWMDRKLFTPDDLHPLINVLVANLDEGIGEIGTDTVFLRSFSVLVLAAVMYYDNQKQPFLTEPETRDLLFTTIAYFAAERDLRGYVPVKGWAHSCAHTSDLLDEFACHRFMSVTDLQRILTAYAGKVTAETGTIYLYNEDDRMSYGIVSAFKRDLLPRDWVLTWLTGLGGLRERLGRLALFGDPGRHSAYINTKNLLRSLYVRLNDDQLPESVREFAPDVHAALQNF